jgi:putative aldouronate transport system permease protein
MFGLLMAFEKYSPAKGVFGSKWIWFKHFTDFFTGPYLWRLVRNTVCIGVIDLAITFPAPIIFALLLNYVRQKRFKKAVQMISYAPHFISTVVICSMVSLFCSPRGGAINLVLNLFGHESIDFLAKGKFFKTIYVISGVWQQMGWNAIIYLAALSGVDQEMHEAAIVDGATLLQRIIRIDLPSITPTIVMLLILRLGSLMSVGFEKVYLLQNSLNYDASEIISTYVYKVGLIDFDYSFSTAVGLFNSVINVIILVSANTFSKKVLKESLW